MPSEERVEGVFEAIAGAIEKHRSAVVTAVEEVRGFLAAHQSGNGDRHEAAAVSLGAFASGRIDVGMFAKIVSTASEDYDPDTLRKVAKALEVLQTLSNSGNARFYLKLSSGERLHDAVASRFAEIGRGFAAARLAGQAALGAVPSANAEELLGPLGFDRWSGGERRLAPPLVVELEGADLHAPELAGFLDGNVKLVLLVNGDAPPAPLVRLITPRTFVQQASEPRELAPFAASEPPAIAALMPSSGAAYFIHDPARGDPVFRRLSIVRLPDKPPRKKLGGISPEQQQEELDQLRALASSADAGAAAGVPAAGQESMTSVDKLAAWLLSQTDLSDSE